MSTQIENVQGFAAACSFNADAAAAAFFRNRGFAAAFVRNGVGDYSLTLSEALDLAGGNGVVLSGINGNAGGMLTVEVVSATVLRIRAFNAAAAAADIDFWLLVMPLGPN